MDSRKPPSLACGSRRHAIALRPSIWGAGCSAPLYGRHEEIRTAIGSAWTAHIREVPLLDDIHTVFSTQINTFRRKCLQIKGVSITQPNAPDYRRARV